jgi:hypothetical protein
MFVPPFTRFSMPLAPDNLLEMISDSCRGRFHSGARVTWRLIVFVTSASFLFGCAIHAPKLPIAYVPQQSVQPIKDADVVSVQVKVEDLQPETLNHFGESDRHFLVKDAPDTVKEAAETELKSRGFKIGNGGALVTIQLIHFEGDLDTEPFGVTTTAHGDLIMRVQVRPQTGKVLYSRELGGEGAPISKVFMWHPATHELEQSLSDAFKRLFGDPAFTAAILATHQPPPAKPVSPGRIAGAFATMSRR